MNINLVPISFVQKVERAQSSIVRSKTFQPPINASSQQLIFMPETTPNNRTSNKSGAAEGIAKKKTSLRTRSNAEQSLDCYMANESIQLSRPSTAKSSTKSIGTSKRT